MNTFQKTSTVDVPVGELYGWHARAGAFERLLAPWQKVELVERTGGIEDGARLIMRLYQGAVPVTWEALHRDHIECKQFVDEQIRGPFSHWVHTHQFESVKPSQSRLIDRVEYKLPAGAVGNWLGHSKVEDMLGALFQFRHRRTAEDLQRHQALEGRKLRVAISGASGTVGRALTAFLTAGGHEVLRLVRRRTDNHNAVYWSIENGEIDAEKLEGLDAMIHLAGENIGGGRWTPARKHRILESRREGTRLIAEALTRLKQPPKAFICASGVGYYGDGGDAVLSENVPRGEGFLAEVCEAWENACEPARVAGIRTINMRLGVVLDPLSGALERMLPAVRLGLTSRVGPGNQYMSWVDLDDVLGGVLFMISHPNLSGPINLTSSEPVTNATFMQTLADTVDRPALIPAPSFALKAVMGTQAANETALISQRAVPSKLLEAGFSFYYASLQGSLAMKLGVQQQYSS